MDDYSDYDRDTAETMAFRTKTIDTKQKELDVRRQQAAELAAEIRKLKKSREEYAERRARERGKKRQTTVDDVLPGVSVNGDGHTGHGEGGGERGPDRGGEGADHGGGSGQEAA